MALARLASNSQSSEAEALAKRAKGILVFPKIVKGGLIVGAQAGEGALRVSGNTADYYSSVAVSYGLQAGVQWFGYAMYFMNDSARNMGGTRSSVIAQGNVCFRMVSRPGQGGLTRLN